MASASYYITYLPQVWQNIDCPTACSATQGTPVDVGANTAVTGIDFALVERDAILGRVTNDQNMPLPGALVDLFDADTHAYVATTATDAQGNYAVRGAVGSAYYVATEAGGGYIDQIYAGVVCPLGPAYLHQCPFTNATAIGLSPGALQPHVANFVLSQPPDEIFTGKFE